MLVQPLLNCQVHSRMCKTVCCRIVLCTVARVQLSSGSVNGFLPHYETQELLKGWGHLSMDITINTQNSGASMWLHPQKQGTL